MKCKALCNQNRAGFFPNLKSLCYMKAEKRSKEPNCIQIHTSPNHAREEGEKGGDEKYKTVDD